MHAQQAVSSEKKGILYAVLSGFLYGLLGYFGMTLIRSGLSTYNLSFWRFLVSFVFLAVIFIFIPSKKTGDRKQHMRAIMNGALFYSPPSILFFIASQYIGTGQAMVIFFSFPAFVMVLNWILLGQTIKPYYFLSFAVILAGLILLVDMGEVSFDVLGIGLSLLSAISYAFYVFFSKQVTIPAINSTMMVSLGCCLTSLVIAAIDGSFIVPMHAYQWLNIVALSVICTAVPILLMLLAMQYISSERASLLSVLEPVFTVIFGVLLLSETLSMRSLFGIILTLIGAMTVSVKWKSRS
jgi:drug/metabolite transporter (DMT)-like permease